MSQWPSLIACIRAVDRKIPADDDGSYSFGDRAKISASFQRFGDGAKRELIARATGRHIAWRHLADQILADWPGWTASDVPTLRLILRANPGGMISSALGELATDDAILALAEDAQRNEPGQFQTGAALGSIGARASSNLMFVPTGEYSRVELAEALRVMSVADGMPIVDYLAAQAADAQQPRERRVEALNAPAQIESDRRDQNWGIDPKVRPDLDDPEVSIRKAALEVIRWRNGPSLRDPAILPRLVEFCNLTPDLYSVQFETEQCLGEITALDAAARPFGAEIARKFLPSANATDRADAATVLAFLGYRPAVPRFIAMLEESDWRVVYAAARGLGWLGATEAIPTLDKVAQNFWLPEVRNEAAQTSAALKTTGVTPRPRAVGGFARDAKEIRINMDVIPDEPYCKSDPYWEGKRITLPNERKYESRVAFRDGELTAEDHGEFGGALKWKPRGGKVETLLPQNTPGLVSFDGGAIAVVDAANAMIATGDSYAVLVTRPANGKWQVKEIGRFPTGAFGIVPLGPDLFATWGWGNNFRVVVFSSKGILGLANCQPGP